jgi:protein SCO1
VRNCVRDSHTLTGVPKQSRAVSPALAGALALALVLAAIGLVLIISSGSGSGEHVTSSSAAGSISAARASKFDGAPLPENTPAPDFTLTDQQGRRVSLSEYRGHVVVLTFLYSTCGGPCVLIAQQIRGALNELTHPVPVLIVSADPTADTPAHLARFLAEVSLSGRAQYLTGAPALLRRVWRAYHVRPASVGPRLFAEYASVLLIDGRGHERVLYQSEQLTPESISHDIEALQAAE